MLQLILYCLIAGCIGSLLQGMIGIGTGVIVVPLLSWILPNYGYSQNEAVHIALATSMAAIAINSVSALIGHHKQGNIDWILSKRMVLICVLGASAGAFTANYLSGRYLSMIYGVFLIYIAIRMFVKFSDNNEDVSLPSQKKLIFWGGSIGFVASLVGSGGGILMVPFLRSLKIKLHSCVGTSNFIGLPVSIIGASTYGLMNSGVFHWPALLAISITGMIFVPIGTKLITIIPSIIVQRIFAIIVSIIGLKMLFI